MKTNKSDDTVSVTNKHQSLLANNVECQDFNCKVTKRNGTVIIFNFISLLMN